MSIKKLSYEEWEKLNYLIGKIGFGGYYDMLEFLKMIIEDLKKITNKNIKEDVKTIQDAIFLISSLVKVLK